MVINYIQEDPKTVQRQEHAATTQGVVRDSINDAVFSSIPYLAGRKIFPWL